MKKLLIVLAGLMFFGSSCIKRCDPEIEGADARAVLKSTVKIYAKVSGHKRVFASDPSAVDGPKDFEPETIKWVGSGVVVRTDMKAEQSLIMSAAHVTNMIPPEAHREDGLHIFVAEKIELTVETLDGTKCSAVQLAANKDTDVSVIRSNCVAGTAAEIASELPPIGSSVMVSGAALGFHPKNIFIITDGRYMGIDEDDGAEVVTLPAVSGHSGSGIFHEGKVVGIVSRRAVDFEHITLCVNLENIQKVFSLAEKVWALEKANPNPARN